MSKGGKAFIVVGAPGMGKTTFNKEILSQVHPATIWLYDVNNEYTDFVQMPLLKFDKFCEIALTKTDSLIVFEEATIFLSNKGSNVNLKEILVRKRHTRNVILLVFHSLRSVPKYLLDLCNYLVLHKTNDPEYIAESFEHPELLKTYQEIKASEMLQKPGGKPYSPRKIVLLSP